MGFLWGLSMKDKTFSEVLQFKIRICRTTAADSCWHIALAVSKTDEQFVLWESESVKCFEATSACFASHVDSEYHKGVPTFSCDFSGTNYSNVHPCR